MMKNSAAKYLLPVHNELPTGLVSELYASKILEVAQNLPMVSVISYECRLAPDSPQVDIALCAYGGNDGITLKEIDVPTYANNREDDLAIEAWRKVRTFGEMWVSENGFLPQFVPALWMNIDIDLEGNSIVEPWIYVVFADTHLLTDLKIAIITKSLSLLQPDFPKNTIGQMETQISRLPQKAHVLGLGLQSARQKETLRLVIYKLNLTEISNFLQRSNWIGDHQDFYNQMVPFEPFASSLGFIFDVDEFSVRTLVGVEFYIERDNQLPGIEKLLQLLVKRALCSEEKSKETIEWVKSSVNKNDESPERWVSHVKISYETANALEAKIYLYHQFNLNAPAAAN